MNKQAIIYSTVLFILLITEAAGTVTLHDLSLPDKLAVSTTDSKVNWIGRRPTGEHNGYVRLASGEIIVNKNEITGGSFIIDLNSIVDIDLKDENMNSRLVGHLKSADFFDVEKYPTAKFVITKVSRLAVTYSETAKATHRIEGNLTMKGITKDIMFDASINLLKGKLTATVSPFTINRTHWNVNYQSKSIFAELKDQFINDDITLSIELVSR